jgi:hypothetical protein
VDLGVWGVEVADIFELGVVIFGLKGLIHSLEEREVSFSFN